MKIALVNPHWTYDGSIYFGCRAPHLPLELGYCKALLTEAGHECLMLDGQLDGLDNAQLAARVRDFAPAMTVVTTAPTYLFWRCAPPELRVPGEFLSHLGNAGGERVVVGPHGSVTPKPVLQKLGADVVVRGECEEVVLQLASTGDRSRVPAIAYRDGSNVRVTGAPAAARFTNLPALAWPDAWVQRHHHHHHRFDRDPQAPGAEVEASRGCPYSCTFCAKIDFRDKYRQRDLAALQVEIDGLLRQGIEYIYFIDEIFLPQKPLLEYLETCKVQFGIQTRIDLWKPDMLDLLGRAGCVSIEAGVESLTVEGREQLAKRCRLDTEELADRLIEARRHVPFVQANLIAMPDDEADLVASWRDRLQRNGVWANDPVPLFPYPSSPDYRALWGEPDDQAWERAHAHYLGQFSAMSDLQEAKPAALAELERACCR